MAAPAWGGFQLFLIQVGCDAVKVVFAAKRDGRPVSFHRKRFFSFQARLPTMDQALAMLGFRIRKPDGLFEDWGVALWIGQYRNEIVYLFSPLLARLDRSSRRRQLTLAVEPKCFSSTRNPLIAIT